MTTKGKCIKDEANQITKLYYYKLLENGLINIVLLLIINNNIITD
jgi:hypothetical protein